MEKFIIRTSAALGIFYAVLLLVSKIIDFMNHLEYIEFMEIMEEIEKDNDEL